MPQKANRILLEDFIRIGALGWPGDDLSFDEVDALFRKLMGAPMPIRCGFPATVVLWFVPDLATVVGGLWRLGESSGFSQICPYSFWCRSLCSPLVAFVMNCSAERFEQMIPINNLEGRLL